MTRETIIEKLTEIFRDVLDDETLVITPETTANDVPEWDSLSHMMLLSEIESVFEYKFSMKQSLGMKNIGEMIDILEKK